MEAQLLTAKMFRFLSTITSEQEIAHN